MVMDNLTRQAFNTPWDLCTPEQKALREKHLPSRNYKADQDARAAELIRRYVVGEWLSRDDKREARRLIK